ncbi:hypothetical protein INT46_011169 [Mucor plumbeus]|uniref:Xylanolytic transcriptional activator regulatory domain-containing protein n=1 Tax=Mucor plumbeus TaxID=97098 RepID=A0A8H7UW37_9FUNG|nr:hypothetical protein INT46_011169 [Mucor plumbeus]
MAHKSNAKRKGQNNNSKAKEKVTTPHDDIESLQITFYEIESWIEKTTPVLTRMTKELEKASGHFDKRRKENQKAVLTEDSQQHQKFIDTKNLEQQLLQFQQQQQQQPLPWKRNLLSNNADNTTSPFTSSSTNLTNDNSMQWLLSFQPGNLLRLDTNITSVEQLIQAVQKIRLLQSEEAGPSNSTSTTSTTLALPEDEDMALELLCSSPSSSSTDQTPDAYVEYWQYALGRRPKICLENYKHCRMNLNGLTKDISPTALNYIGQVFWDCLHPKFSSDWNSFWDRSGDAKRNQVCIDSGLAMVFLHVMRHDKDICENSQEIAGFYYDRAREELMEFFDESPDCSTIEALLNLSMFCIVCKRYSQAKIYVGLCLHMVMECGIHKASNLPTDDLILRKKYLKLLLILYYNDSTLSVYIGDSASISDTEFDINFYEIISLNDTLFELNKSKDINDRIDFDNGKTIVKESYFVHTVELVRLTKKTNQLIERGATVKQLLSQEKFLEQWYKRLPDIFRSQSYNYEQLEQLKLKREKEKDLTTPMDAKTLQAQAALLLKIQYDSQWIILHKAILNSIRRSTTTGSSPSLSGQERRSSTICSTSADSIVKISEVITRCFGWCVCQQIITCLYHASTVYCGNALIKDDLQLKNRAKVMIHRIMRILEACRIIYAGFPDDMTDCLCEFLKNHGMHNSLECSCKSGEETSPPDLAMADIKEDEDTLLASLFNHNHDIT